MPKPHRLSYAVPGGHDHSRESRKAKEQSKRQGPPSQPFPNTPDPSSKFIRWSADSKPPRPRGNVISPRNRKPPYARFSTASSLFPRNCRDPSLCNLNLLRDPGSSTSGSSPR
jgi:hypothetical protein